MENKISSSEMEQVEFCFINFIKKAIIRESRKFFKASRSGMNCLANEYEEIEDIADPTIDIEQIQVKSDELENLFSDEKMYKLFKLLTEKQKKVLYYKHILGFTEDEIAQVFRTTRQAVNKVKLAAVKRLRKGK